MKRWYKYIKPYLPYFIIGPLCMIVEVIGEVLMPRLLAIVINNGADGVGVGIGTGLLMILCAFLMMAGGVGGAYFGAKASVNFATDLRCDAYKSIQKFSFSNIDKFSTGSLVTRLTNDVTQLQNFVNMILRMALRSPGIIIGALIMAISINPPLSVVLVVTVPLMVFSIIGLIVSALPRFSKMQVKIDNLNSTVQENVTNVRVVKSFVREEREIEKFATANADLKSASMRATKLMIMLAPIMNLFMYATIIIVVWSGHADVLRGVMDIGDLSAFIAYVNQILHSLMMVSFLFTSASRAMASARRISEVLDEKIDISDFEAKNPEKQIESGKIEFRNVKFKYYKNSDEQVLDDISFTIEPGKTVGIIGSTGCGKTTLVSMIPRLYDVDEGSVLVDGVDVKNYSLKNLREGIGMVLQKNLLFSGTISENLKWGDKDATDEDIIVASKHAAADKFITSFKDGYDTLLEKGGNNVSGGQKQRLCIARAILKKPKILILDDSTSAVDTATERQIKTALYEELHGCTKIIIAQRISSVRDADMIIVMDDGRITGIGTHEQLLNNNKEYDEIYYSQNEKEQREVI
ncbi:MAG: ABC transporter ATP-binding protein [Clostridia bacterium]|nr:ABC transporter ATP-binding protein [Clostridia bacterium]